MTVEEKLAALEARVEALEADRGEGSYVSKYSGEEIDALLDKVSAMSG